MATSGFINFIDCAALKIYALPEAEINVTNGTISKTLGTDDVFEVEAGWKIYVVYIQEKDFGTWTVVSTIGNTDRQKTITINNFSLYTITLVLPNEYQPVEYLKSNADAYIRMSELTYNDCDGADIDFQFNQQYSGNTIYSIFGGRYQDNSVMYGLLHWAGKLYVIPPDGGYVNQDLIRHRVKWGNKFNWQVIYDNQIIATTTDSGVRGTFCLDLFNSAHRNGSGGAYGGDYRSKSQIYHVNLYQGQEMIRNMWPCYRKSDYVAGMYDVITDTFYTSNVSATFTFGVPIDIKNPPLYLYNRGNENISITGGWSGSGWLNESSAACDLATNTGTALRCAPTSGKQSIAATINKIDLTNYSYIVYKGTRIKAESNGVCVQWSGISSTKKAGSNMEKYFNVNNTGVLDYNLDISSLVGSYYVVFCTGNSNNCIAEATEIYLI